LIDCVQIAWDYLDRSNQISDASFASRFLSKHIEMMVRKGEHRPLLVANKAITAYQAIEGNTEGSLIKV